MKTVSTNSNPALVEESIANLESAHNQAEQVFGGKSSRDRLRSPQGHAFAQALANDQLEQLSKEIDNNKTWTGRAAGCGAAAIATGLEIYANGLTSGAVVGGVVGGLTGYYTGNIVDKLQGVAGGNTSVLACMVPALFGFAAANTAQVICDRYTPKETSSESILGFAEPVEIVNQFGL